MYIKLCLIEIKQRALKRIIRECLFIAGNISLYFDICCVCTGTLKGEKRIKGNYGNAY